VFSVLFGLTGVAVIPAAVIAAEFYDVMTLLESAVSIRRQAERTLGRTRGRSVAATGRVLGYIGLYLAVTASISVATYYVLREFAA
jgi:hypothetical protein